MGVDGESRGPALTSMFEVVLWGYDRQQVTRCIADLEAQLTLLYADQRRAVQLVSELEKCHTENLELRARASGVPTAHRVGAEIETILAAAERQALEIRASAEGVLSTARQEAVQILAAAKQQAARSERDCELLAERERQKSQLAANELLAAARQEAEHIVSLARPGVAAAGQRASRPGPAQVKAAENGRAPAKSHDAATRLANDARQYRPAPLDEESA